MAKNAPKRAQAEHPATESRGPAKPLIDGEATQTLSPRRSGEELAADNARDQLQRIQLLADTAGRIFRALTGWLTHEQKHMRVLGWITWLFLLGAFAGVLLVLLFRWHPLHTIALIGGSTGLIACANLVNRFFRRR